MKLSEILQGSHVLLDQHVADKDDLFDLLAAESSPELDLPADLIRQALLDREELGTTGIGDGIAIPHAPVDGLERPFAMLLRLAEPIAFNAVDEEPVDLVFFMLFPPDCQNVALTVLSAASRRFRRSEVQDAARREADADAVCRLMTDGDARAPEE